MAISAAKEAGEVLRGAFGGEQAIRHKGEVDIVTEADERAEAVIRDILPGVSLPTECSPRREARCRGNWMPAG